VSTAAGIFIPVLPSEWVGQYIDGGPFTNFIKTFAVSQAVYYSSLELDVLTGYDSYASSASVKVNGIKVGTIEPRPWSRYQDPQAVVILFGNGVLNGNYPHNGLNQLRIDPVSQSDWLVVGRWRLLYQRAA